MEAAAWALFAATVGLVVATFVLAQHTKVPANLTRQIVQIEKQSDHRKKLETALDLARKIQTLSPETFINEFRNGHAHGKEQADYFCRSEVYSDLTRDADSMHSSRDPVQNFDDVWSQRSMLGTK